MAKQTTVTVYPTFPVTGFYIIGVAAVETTTDPETAERLVATGAFAYEAAEPPAPPPDAATTEGVSPSDTEV